MKAKTGIERFRKKLSSGTHSLESGLFTGIFILLIPVLFACRGSGQSSTETKQNFSEFMSELKQNTGDTLDTATFGNGCFWCSEAVFQRLKGVQSTLSGYSGGTVKNPSYREVCTGRTGHAEVIQVTYNPQEISYAQLLEVFFSTHDPTSLNRQGGDIGTQYRSVIFYHNPEQKRLSELAIQAANESADWDKPIVTEVAPLEAFYPAEDYHDNYYNLNKTSNPYCTVVIEPKLDKFKKKFAELIKS